MEVPLTHDDRIDKSSIDDVGVPPGNLYFYPVEGAIWSCWYPDSLWKKHEQKVDDLGVPLFLKPLDVYIYIYVNTTYT